MEAHKIHGTKSTYRSSKKIESERKFRKKQLPTGCNHLYLASKTGIIPQGQQLERPQHTV